MELADEPSLLAAKQKLKEIVYELTEDKLIFKQTCIASPEQYDVYLEGKQVAYIRLRWGYLSVEYPNVNGIVIYHHKFTDEYKGSFDTRKERVKYMKIIKYKILEHLEHETQKNSKRDSEQIKI